MKRRRRPDDPDGSAGRSGLSPDRTNSVPALGGGLLAQPTLSDVRVSGLWSADRKPLTSANIRFHSISARAETHGSGELKKSQGELFKSHA